MSRTSTLRTVEDTGPSPLAQPVRERLHDRLFSYMEDHSPEGRETRGRSRVKRALMLGGAMALLVGALVTLTVLAGPAALGLGVVIILAMCLVGAGPLVLVASERRAERNRFDHRIERRLESLDDRLERKPTEG